MILSVVTEDLSGIQLTVDDSAIELRQAMEKAKRRKEKKNDSWDLEAMVSSIKREPMEEDIADDPNKTSIVLNETAEFCRTLGDIPTYGMAGNRDEDEDELMVLVILLSLISLRAPKKRIIEIYPSVRISDLPQYESNRLEFRI